VNLTMTEARAAAAKDHFTLRVESAVKSITVGNGSIVSQTPKPGTILKQGSTLSVVPSIGKPAVAVPPLTGQTCAQAIALLTANHLTGVCGAGQYSSTVTSGQLISWSLGTTPNPASAPYGSTITLVPSQGHAPVNVPSIPADYTFSEAQAAIQAVGLSATQVSASSASVPAGEIISTSPASGQPAPFGSTVTVTVSSGPPTVVVPFVQGDSVTQATTVLTNAGLVVNSVSGNPNRLVTGTNPPSGTTVPTGSTITIYTA
jgi:eukaryotic-like serine/threonine-protein kinase